MLKEIFIAVVSLIMFRPLFSQAQHEAHGHENNQHAVPNVEAQPLLSQALRLQEALTFLGSSLSKQDKDRLLALQHQPLSEKTTKAIQEILDPYCIAAVTINPESRVKVE